MFRWLIPAAFVLPLWLVIGWAIFNAASAPWALLPVLLIFAPGVFVFQLVAALLVRVRPSARETRAVSWADVAVFGIWHLLTIAVGFFHERTFGIALILAIIMAFVVVGVTGSELWKESRVSREPLVTVRSVRIDDAGQRQSAQQAPIDTIIVQETRGDERP